MPRKRKTKPRPKHPYKKLKHTRLWKSLKKGIKNLIDNQDLQATAERDYIVGYLCKILTPRKPKPSTKPRSRR